jgi:mRNA interferase RelE/StbE
MKPVGYTSAATRDLAKLSAEVRERVIAKIRVYAQTGSGDVKRLKGRHGARLRAGDWRIIFTEDATTIRIDAIGHRRHIYD